jgi:predicted GNAT family N-acyltransferase
MQLTQDYRGIQIQNNEYVAIHIKQVSTKPRWKNSYYFTSNINELVAGKVIFKEENSDSYRSLYIQVLKNKTKTVKGIGTALIQRVIEFSFEQGFKGIITLKASQSSHVFYWKLGFRLKPIYIEDWEDGIIDLMKEMKAKGLTLNDRCILEDPRFILAKQKYPGIPPKMIFMTAQQNRFVYERILESVNSNSPNLDTSDLGYVDMYLPQESVTIWQNIIENPLSREDNLKRLVKVAQIINH